MHRLVIYIGRVGEFVRAFIVGFSVMFLLVHDEVLSTSNYTCVLNSLDGFRNGHTGKNWVRTEA
jgi:hypothetical protein